MAGRPRRPAKPAPWAGYLAGCEITEVGLAELEAGERPLSETDQKRMEALAEAVAAILTDYEIVRDGDYLRFQGNVRGNYASVYIDGIGSDVMPVLLGWNVGWPEEAFEIVAADWIAGQAAAVVRAAWKAVAP